VNDQTDCEIYQEYVFSKTDDHCVGNLDWAIQGLVSEAGEVAAINVKANRKKIDVDPIRILDECGDTLWYLVAVLNACGLSLDECIEHNMDKLNKRAANVE
jgi:NTP pyrophosphatase (non-canonical NTP hydrolase)